MGLIVAAFVCGICIYMSNRKESDMPADGLLVKNCRDIGDEAEKWA